MTDKFEPPVSKEWMSATDAASLLGISRQQLNKQIQDGQFPSTQRVGNSFNLSINEVLTVAKTRGVLAK